MQTKASESEIELGRWTITEDSVRDYLKAVGDSHPTYFDSRLTPPLALTAYALAALLEKLALAPGAIHSMQEVDTYAPAELGREIIGVATLERPRRRGNLEFTTASYTLTDSAGVVVQTGKTTVLSPAAEIEQE